MEDLVGTVAQTFLGLTVNCARCHDHKFDPIRQREYYALVAALAGVRQGNRDLTGLVPTAGRAEQLAALEAQRNELCAELAAIEQPVRERLLADGDIMAADLQPIAAWDFMRDGAEQSAGWEVELHGNARLSADGLVLADDTSYAASRALPRELRAKTLEAWVRLANLDQRGGAVDERAKARRRRLRRDWSSASAILGSGSQAATIMSARNPSADRKKSKP